MCTLISERSSVTTDFVGLTEEGNMQLYAVPAQKGAAAVANKNYCMCNLACFCNCLFKQCAFKSNNEGIS